jgi:F-type H+-transporting ATPase subunit b
MKINWFTLIAQVINFLVLMWLLKRYLYKPILKAIDERENNIVAQLNEAEAKKAEALREREEFNEKNRTFDRQREALMQKAIEESNAKAQKLKEEAREEANLLKVRLEKGVREDQANRNHEIAQRIQQEVVDIARKTLSELSSVGLEEQSLRTFVKKIKNLKEDEKQKFISTLTAGNGSILVKSAFQLSTNQQSEIEQAIAAILGKKRQFDFKVVPELISGIELTANGYKLSWSISEYINTLENSIAANTSKDTQASSENK